MQKKHEIDMCSGPLFSKILIFSIPLMLSGILQLLFNAADLVVVGRYTGSDALAAVGAAAPITHLVINVLMGFSVGANVLVARYYGAKDSEKASYASGNSMMISLVGGIIIGGLGISLSRPLLELFNTPADILDQAAIYVQIYFAGLPVISLYNFGSSVLRAVGDTTRPLIYLIIAGVINVILNLIFTIVFDMGVMGVAIATVVSQCVSAVLVVRILFKPGSWYSLNRVNIRPNKHIMLQLAQIGIPAGVNGSLFAVSNSIIQSGLNSFGADVVAGCSAANNIDAFLWTITDSLANATLAFTSQNMGAGNFKRIKKVFGITLSVCLIVSLIGGMAMAIFPEPLLRIYTDLPTAIKAGSARLIIMGYSYTLAALMNIVGGALRGLGYSTLPTIITLCGTCLLRVVWIYLVFPIFRSVEALMMCYPTSWMITSTALLISFLICFARMAKKYAKTHSFTERSA